MQVAAWWNGTEKGIDIDILIRTRGQQEKINVVGIFLVVHDCGRERKGEREVSA
jgi:hypothetical protein